MMAWTPYWLRLGGLGLLKAWRICCSLQARLWRRSPAQVHDYSVLSVSSTRAVRASKLHHCHRPLHLRDFIRRYHHRCAIGCTSPLGSLMQRTKLRVPPLSVLEGTLKFVPDVYTWLTLVRASLRVIECYTHEFSGHQNFMAMLLARGN